MFGGRAGIRKEGGVAFLALECLYRDRHSSLEEEEGEVTMVVDCLVQFDGGKWKRRQVNVKQN